MVTGQVLPPNVSVVPRCDLADPTFLHRIPNPHCAAVGGPCRTHRPTAPRWCIRRAAGGRGHKVPIYLELSGSRRGGYTYDDYGP